MNFAIYSLFEFSIFLSSYVLQTKYITLKQSLVQRLKLTFKFSARKRLIKAEERIEKILQGVYCYIYQVIGHLISSDTFISKMFKKTLGSAFKVVLNLSSPKPF